VNDLDMVAERCQRGAELVHEDRVSAEMVWRIKRRNHAESQRHRARPIVWWKK
jgi:hypothetical protein